MTGSIVIPGRATGKGRARFSSKTGRHYTPADTVTAEDRVREAWRAAGAPGPYTEPMGVHITIVLCRPKDHYRVDGVTLSAAGDRTPIPVGKPDWDNAGKLISDALNGCLWRDDKQIAYGAVAKRWAHAGEDEHVRVDYWQASLEDEEFAA